MDLQSIKDLIQLVERSNITELQIENGDLRIAIKKGGSGGTAVAASAPAAAAALPPAPAAPPAAAYHTITSPMVGTFYAAPSPEDKPFVQVGSTVREGQVIGIIEAMKLMNEIEADRAGRVKEILIQNAQPVEYGQALMVLEPLS